MDVEQKIRQGVQLARDSKRMEAEAIFAEVLTVQPDNPTALIWKAAVAQSPAEAVRCLERVLEINPENARARAGLEWAQRRLKTEKVTQFPGTIAENDPIRANLSTEAPAQPKTNSKPSNSRTEPINLSERLNNRASQVAVGSPAKTVAKSPVRPPETLDDLPPYKRSRFKNSEKSSSEAGSFMTDTPTIARPRPRRGFSFGRSRLRQPFQVTSPRSGNEILRPTVSVSDKVERQQAGHGDKNRDNAFEYEYGKTAQVRLSLPLSLFAVAIGLALLSFVLTALAAVLGSLALLLALVGVVLFNRAEF